MMGYRVVDKNPSIYDVIAKDMRRVQRILSVWKRILERGFHFLQAANRRLLAAKKHKQIIVIGPEAATIPLNDWTHHVGPWSTSMPSKGPNLLNCFIGSSDPLDGLVIEIADLILFEDCGCGLEVDVVCGCGL